MKPILHKSAAIRATLTAVLLFAVRMLLPCAQAQQREILHTTVPELRAKAEKGDAQSQNDLGEALNLGKPGMKTNYAEAVKWFRQAAEQNYALAQHNLGDCYLDGKGVAKNYGEAVKWFRQAAEQNYAETQCDLGLSYVTGEGVAQDYVEAVNWLRKAAEQNDAQAQHNLGVCYAYGLGVTHDYVEAYKWWLLADAQGHKDTRGTITGLESQLTREQVAEGKRRAQAWLEQHKKANHEEPIIP